MFKYLISFKFELKITIIKTVYTFLDLLVNELRTWNLV